MKKEEDVYSPESEKKRVLSTLKNRVTLWNYAERLLNPRYALKTIESTGIDTNDVSEMIKFIIHNKDRIDHIREYLKLHGTPLQKVKLSEPLMNH